MKRNEHPLLEGIPQWIVRGGVTSILIAAMIAAGFGILWLIGYAAPISIPFLLAFVIGIIVFPLVKIGDRLRIPRKVSAFLLVFLVFVALWAAVQMTIMGLVSEAPKIGAQLEASVQGLGTQLDDVLVRVGMTQDQVNRIITDATKSIQDTFNPATGSGTPDGLLQSIASGIGSLGSAVSGVASALFSVLIAAMILYYLLSDYEKIEGWIETHLGVEPELGMGIVEDTTSSMRDYFKGITIKGAITAGATGLILLVFGVPLVIPAIIITFITGYIPFIGAWIAVLFAVLVTFGTKGLTTALIVLLLTIVIQNLLEQIVFNRVVGDQLNIHPLVILAVTIFGFTFAGLLGGMLAAPLAAMVMRIYARLKAARELQDEFERTGTLPIIRDACEPESTTSLSSLFKDIVAKS